MKWNQAKVNDLVQYIETGGNNTIIMIGHVFKISDGKISINDISMDGAHNPGDWVLELTDGDSDVFTCVRVLDNIKEIKFEDIEKNYPEVLL